MVEDNNGLYEDLNEEDRALIEELKRKGIAFVKEVQTCRLPHHVQGTVIALQAYICMDLLTTELIDDVVKMVKFARQNDQEVRQ